MDYCLKVRFEAGPGIPSGLARLDEPNARKAVLKALFDLLLMDEWPAGFISKGTHGETTACVFATRTRHFAEPSGVIPTSSIDEFEFTVELEGPEEVKFRGSESAEVEIPADLNGQGAGQFHSTRS